MMNAPPDTFSDIWTDYLAYVGDAQRKRARRDLEAWFPDQGLQGKLVLDLGAGSGLQSLAALDAGAAQVQSIDREPAPAQALLAEHAELQDRWSVLEGSITDATTMETVDVADVVLFWGTPSFCVDWKQALALLSQRVRPGARLLLAMPYMTEELLAETMRRKQRYRDASPSKRSVIIKKEILKRKLAMLRQGKSVHAWQFTRERGASVLHELLLAHAGWPYVTASVDEVNQEARRHGWVLDDLYVAPEGKPNELLFCMEEVRA